MAVNKRKVLDAARKYAQKGAKEKALKEYHTLLKLDPRDAKLHLEIGDCYRRWGQIEEAITQYSRVADQYKEDGFDARSVAVFKQILNLDPKRYAAYVSLAELYQRMGLDAEALGALQAAADGYHKEGDKPAALELLRKMATLDPTNTTSRLKVAELLRQEGMEDDAVAEYEAVVQEFERQSAPEQTIPVLERILELRPDRVDAMLEMARKLVAARTPERAEPFARKAAEIDPEDSDALEVLCDIYKALGDDEALALQTRALAKIYRERGDDDKAREIAQRVPLSMELAGDDAAPAPPPAPDETESAFLSDDELLDDDFLAADQSDVRDLSEELPLEDGAELELELDDEAGSDELMLDEEPAPAEDDLAIDFDEPPAAQDEAGGEEESGSDDAPLPEGDPDQLLAEASVYLRYGKRDKAIASLRAVVAQEPDHRGALEKLGDAFAEDGDDDGAVEMWQRAAARANADGDREGFDVLRDRIAALDPDAAEALAADAGPADAAEVDDPSIEIDGSLDDFEIDVSVGDDEEPAPAGDDAEVEIDLSTDAEDVAAADDVDFEIDIDLDDDAEAEGAGDAAFAPAAESAGESSTASQQVAEDLEEAEFYFGQDMFDEAEAIYRRVLEVAPNHPSALLRLGELAARRGEDPGEAPNAKADTESKTGEKSKPAKKSKKEAREPEVAAADVDEDFEIDIDADEAVETPTAGEDSTEVAELSLAPDEADEPAVQMDQPHAVEPPAHSSAEDTLPFDEAPADEEVEADAGDEVLSEDARADLDAAFEEDALDVDDAEEADEESEAAAEEDDEPIAAAADEQPDDDDEDEGGGFDLAAELRDVIEDDDDEPAEGDADRSTVEDGFESIFADFKQGVSATLSDDDYETRYDLGIAYREMELYEDAIGEFRMCLDSPSWKLGSLHMMGLCALDLGRAQDASNHLEQALASPDLPAEQVAGLQFDLGRALEVAGDADRARSAYEAALEADPSLPGVQERIDALASGAPAPGLAEPGDEGFESFDDLVAEAQEDEDDTTEQTESFESFDDVITEVESSIEDAAPESADVVLEAEPLDETPDEAAEEPAADAGASKKKRKKKISFV